MSSIVKNIVMKTQARKLIVPVLVGFLAVAGLTLSAGEPAVNPTGTWRSTISSTKTQAPSAGQTLRLKLERDRLSGTLSRVAGGKIEQLPIEDAKLKGSEISFATRHYALVYENNVLQPTDTNKVTHSKFQGQISGDTIKGKVKREYMGNSRTQDWEAKRVKE